MEYFYGVLIVAVFMVMKWYFKTRRFHAIYELTLWQTFLRAKEANSPELFNVEKMFSKFMELSDGKYVKQSIHEQALKNTFEKDIDTIKANEGIYFSVIRKGRVLDFSSLFQ